MEERITSISVPKKTADYKAAIDLMLQEMDRIEARMQRDRTDIERLKAETEIIKAHANAVLDSLEKQLISLQKVE